MKQKTNNKIIVFLGVIFFIFMIYIFPSYQKEINHIAKQEVKSLDSRLYYSKQDVLNLFKIIQKKGREKTEFISGVVDMIYPVVYGILFFLIITKFLNNRWKIISITPFVAMFFDYVENFSVLNMINKYPTISEKQVLISSLATSLKWLFVIISILLITTLAVLSKYTSHKRII